MLVVPPALERVRVAPGPQRRGRALAEPRPARCKLRQAELRQPPARLDREPVAAAAHVIPVMLGLDVDRGRDAQVGGRILRPLPAVPRREGVLALAPTDD